MSVDKWIFYTGVLVGILSILIKKNKKVNIVLLVTALLLIFSPIFLPRQIFGKWNSIKMLKKGNVSKIILQPSLPEWEVNLTSSIVIISNNTQIDYIIKLLKKTDAYFPGHSPRIWETKMILVTQNNDSIFLKVDKSPNQGTGIYVSEDVFRNDALAAYLEKITNFTTPQFSIEFKKGKEQQK